MKNSKLKKWLITQYELFYPYIDNIRYLLKVKFKYKITIMSFDETIDCILKNKYSLSRYGDGEMSMMLDSTANLGFQVATSSLVARLNEVLFENKNKNVLICMPRYLVSLNGCTKDCKKHWKRWRRQKGVRILDTLYQNIVAISYGDTQITRPYIDLQSKKSCARQFSRLKEIWDRRDIIIVEGENTRLGVGNDLFANAISIKRILAPAVNAFSKYDEILSVIKKHHNGELILIALGPTATVLAADLASETCQAIDIGHIDVEYEWFLSGTKKKIPISGKYVNEVNDGKNETQCLDETYLSQIIERI